MTRNTPILLLVLVSASGCALFNDNFRAVQTKEFYRSGQMSPERLVWTCRNYGIKTVISLRGIEEGAAWHSEEIAACERLGIERYDIPWTKSRVPTPESLQQFIELCDTAEKPILVHCQGGTHRAGTASAIYELLRGESAGSARKQFGVFFFDAPIGEIVTLYEGSSVPFRDWVRHEYPTLHRSLD